MHRVHHGDAGRRAGRQLQPDRLHGRHGHGRGRQLGRRAQRRDRSRLRLEQIGEGKNCSNKGPEKLFGNNEDYTVLRAAYTDKRHQLHRPRRDQRLDARGTGNDSGSYNDISNPYQQTSPSSTEPDEPRAGQPRHDRAALHRLARHDHHQPRRQLRHVPVRVVGERRRQRRLQPDLLHDLDRRQALVRAEGRAEHRLHVLGLGATRTKRSPTAKTRSSGSAPTTQRPRLRPRRGAEPRRVADDGVLRLPAAQADHRRRHGARDQHRRSVHVGAEDPALYRNILTRPPRLGHLPGGGDEHLGELL